MLHRLSYGCLPPTWDHQRRGSKGGTLPVVKILYAGFWIGQQARQSSNLAAGVKWKWEGGSPRLPLSSPSGENFFRLGGRRRRRSLGHDASPTSAPVFPGRGGESPARMPATPRRMMAKGGTEGSGRRPGRRGKKHGGATARRRVLAADRAASAAGRAGMRTPRQDAEAAIRGAATSAAVLPPPEERVKRAGQKARPGRPMRQPTPGPRPPRVTGVSASDADLHDHRRGVKSDAQPQQRGTAHGSRARLRRTHTDCASRWSQASGWSGS